MPVTWSDSDDAIIGGDLVVALAYVTPAGGAVVAAVTPIGLRDRERGTVAFTTSLAFGRKLDRIRANPRVAIACHAREHGFAEGSRYVLVQGTASFDESPDQALLENVIGPAAERFMGPQKRGRFWDRWLREYSAERVLVTVTAERVVSWPDLRCAGEPAVSGAPQPAEPPAPQDPPRGGTGPRVGVARAARRLRALPHVLAGFAGADGFPVVVPVEVGEDGSGGIALSAAGGLLPSGGRRAGVLGHSFNAQLIGLEARQHTGWLEVGEAGTAIYAPHTEFGFRAPANKTLLLLGNGFMAKRGLRQARRKAAR